MKKIFFILLIIIIITLVFILGFNFFQTPTSDVKNPDTVLPDTEQVVTPLEPHVPSLLNKSGNRVPVRNFIKDLDTIPLANDFYEVRYESDEGGDVGQIYYYSGAGNILILLDQNPLADSRVKMEEELKAMTELSEVELCDLDVVVTTDENINFEYAGKNIGLSFCPGSEQFKAPSGVLLR